MERPHAVIIPYPGPGHINPMLKLAKILHSRGFYITFVNTEFNHQRILRSSGPHALKCPDGFRFETITDGLSSSDRESPQHGVKLCLSMKMNSPAPFRELLVRLNHSSGVPPITCIIPNGLMSFTLDVSEKLGIPALVFWTTSACGFMGYLHLGELIRRGYTPLKDESFLRNGYLDTPIDWIPGMKGIRLGDLPSFIRTTDGDDVFLNYDRDEANNSFKAWGLILNTFECMEAEVLDALKCMFPHIYTIGPLPALLNRTTQKQWESMSLSLWEEDSGCREWLDTQRAASVLYVNFGSITVMEAHQLTEFAWGLADSNHPFLWIIRPDLVVGADVASKLPEEFVVRTKGRCFLASWCPQEEVLSHVSVGGFLTHGGWNSTLESVCGGVPMICWPGFAEQYTNCRYACEEWGIGIEIDGDVKREQVTGLVRELMEGERGEKVRRNAIRWKERAEQATQPGGGSYADFERLVQDLTPPETNGAESDR